MAASMLDIIAQIMVFITGVSALYLAGSQAKEDRRLAGVVGMAGEPFWLITVIINKQGFIALLVLVYFWNWYRLYKNNT